MATVKIVILGPESTGKTTLTKFLAGYFQSPFVSEFARDYLEAKDSAIYELSDLETIAKGQIKTVEIEQKKNPELLFCDTDLITLHIWSLDKFDRTIPFVEQNMKRFQADFYLLCKPDLTWEYDPLREDANRRDELYVWNAWVLNALNAPYAEIGGQGEIRTSSAISAVKTFLKTAS